MRQWMSVGQGRRGLPPHLFAVQCSQRRRAVRRRRNRVLQSVPQDLPSASQQLQDGLREQRSALQPALCHRRALGRRSVLGWVICFFLSLLFFFFRSQLATPHSPTLELSYPRHGQHRGCGCEACRCWPLPDCATTFVGGGGLGFVLGRRSCPRPGPPVCPSCPTEAFEAAKALRFANSYNVYTVRYGDTSFPMDPNVPTFPGQPVIRSISSSTTATFATTNNASANNPTVTATTRFPPGYSSADWVRLPH